MKVRLQKLLARAGVASRRACEELILAGRVTVDGTVVTQAGVSADPAVADVRLDGEPLRAERSVYYALNKPRGVLTTASDDRSRPTIMALLAPLGRRVFPVGRLDFDTDGLVLVTNDGELAQRIAHPRHGMSKTYVARVRGRLTSQARETLEQGVWLSEGRCQGLKIQRIKPEKHVTQVTVTLTEGKNRELRRIFAKVGNPVVALRRVAVGPVALGSLRTGAYRPLRLEEVTALRLFVSGAEAEPEPVVRGRGAPPRRKKTGTRPAKSTGGTSRTRPAKSTGAGARPAKGSGGGARPAKSKGGGARPAKKTGGRARARPPRR